MPVNLSYPKPRALQVKVFKMLRTDSSTPKCVLPKGAAIVRTTVFVDTSANAGTPTYDLGWAGNTTGIVNQAAVASRGQFLPSGSGGASLMTVLDSDKEIIGTFGASTSASGSTGTWVIEYFQTGPQELINE